jgi:molybdate transport system permease protein
VAMPFLVFAIEGAIRAADRRFDVVAATLGASPGRRLAQVTLPLIAPGIAAGAALSFARALGEYGATVTFATSIPGVTQTLPMAIYARLAADDRDAAIALSLVLIAISVVVLVAFRDRWLPGVLR